MTNTSTLPSGTRRAAQLLTALGAKGAPIWANLSTSDTEKLSAAIDQLDESHDLMPIRPDDLLTDIERTSTNSDPAFAVGALADTSIWQRLRDVPAIKLATLLEAEPPHILALLLLHIGPEKAAGIVKALPPELSVQVMRNILTMGPARAEALTAIEHELSEAFATLAPEASDGGEAALARIFDAIDPKVEEAFLAAIEHEMPGASGRIRSLMFRYDDLAALPPAGMQTLLAHADRKMLIIALKGEDGPVLKAVTTNLTQRAADLLTEEVEMLGPIRRSEVDGARKYLADLARTLLDRGEILSRSAFEQDELVE